MPTTSQRPRLITPDQIIREDVGKPLRQFKFVNRSRYTVLIAWGWNPMLAEIDPDYTIEPYTSQIIMPERPQEKFVWEANSAWGIEQARQSGLDTFSWTATDQVVAVAAASSTALDVLTQPPTDLGDFSLDVTRLINEDNAAETQFIQGQLQGDAGRRIQISTEGILRVGLGTIAPEDVWDVLSGGRLEFLKDVLLPAADPVGPQSAVRLGFLDLIIQREAQNVRSEAAGPDLYDQGWTFFTGTTASGWPETGTVINQRPGGSGGATQMLVGDDLRIRSAATSTTWDAWVKFGTTARTFVSPTIGAKFSAGSLPPGITQYNTGICIFRGRVTLAAGVAVNAGDTIVNVNANQRPQQDLRFAMPRTDLNTGAMVADFSQSNGNVTAAVDVPSTASGRTYTFDGIAYVSS